MKNKLLLLSFLLLFFFPAYAQTELIDSAVVSAEVSLISMNKDTLVFNAKAINTLQGEFAIDILRQLPGVTVRGGKIYLNGREVTETYVNGIKVFGDNPLTAFSNIKAEDVLNISAYEQMAADDKKRGIRNGKKERVFNIRTKDPIFSQISLIANLAAGADGQLDEDGHVRPRYATDLNGNFFSEMFVVESKGSFENVDQSLSSITTDRRQESFRADMEKHWLDRHDGNTFKAGYSYNGTNRQSTKWSRTDYFDIGDKSNLFSTDTSAVHANSNSHSINMTADLKRTPLKSIVASAAFTTMSSSDSSLFRSQNHIYDCGYYRAQHTSSMDNNWNLRSSLTWRNDDMLTFSPAISVEYDLYSTDGRSKDVDTLDTSIISKYIDHNKLKHGSDFSVLPSVSAILVNNDDVLLSSAMSYRFSQKSTEDQRQSTDESYTFNFNSSTTSHFLNTSISSNIKSVNATLYSTLEFTQRSDIPILPKAEMRRDRYCFFSCLATVRTGGSYAELRIQPVAPDLVCMRNYAIVDNPLLAICGNPQLKPSTNVDLSFRHSGQKLQNKLGYSLSGRTTLVSSPVIESISYLSSDIQLSTWGNPIVHNGGILSSYTNGKYSMSADMVFSSTYRHNKRNSMNLEISVNGGIEPQEVDGSLMVRNTVSPAFSLGYTFSPNKKFRMTIGNQTFYSMSSLADGSALLRRLNERASVSINGIWKKWSYKLYADVVCDSISGSLDTDAMCSYPSISINRSFANGRIKIGVIAKDLLNAGQGYSNIITSDYVTRTWSPSFGRYFLLNFRYSFRKNN